MRRDCRHVVAVVRVELGAGDSRPVEEHRAISHAGIDQGDDGDRRLSTHRQVAQVTGDVGVADSVLHRGAGALARGQAIRQDHETQRQHIIDHDVGRRAWPGILHQQGVGELLARNHRRRRIGSLGDAQIGGVDHMNRCLIDVVLRVRVGEWRRHPDAHVVVHILRVAGNRCHGDDPAAADFEDRQQTVECEGIDQTRRHTAGRHCAPRADRRWTIAAYGQDLEDAAREHGIAHRNAQRRRGAPVVHEDGVGEGIARHNLAIWLDILVDRQVGVLDPDRHDDRAAVVRRDRVGEADDVRSQHTRRVSDHIAGQRIPVGAHRHQDVELVAHVELDVRAGDVVEIVCAELAAHGFDDPLAAEHVGQREGRYWHDDVRRAKVEDFDVEEEDVIRRNTVDQRGLLHPQICHRRDVHGYPVRCLRRIVGGHIGIVGRINRYLLVAIVVHQQRDGEEVCRSTQRRTVDFQRRTAQEGQASAARIVRRRLDADNRVLEAEWDVLNRHASRLHRAGIGHSQGEGNQLARRHGCSTVRVDHTLVDTQCRAAVHEGQPHRLIQLRIVAGIHAMHLRLVEDQPIPACRAQSRWRSHHHFDGADYSRRHLVAVAPRGRVAGEAAGRRRSLAPTHEVQARSRQVVCDHHTADRQD